MAGLSSGKKASSSSKRVVKGEVGEGERYRYTIKFSSKYDGKQLKSFQQENNKMIYTIFSTSKHGMFSQKKKIQKSTVELKFLRSISRR